MCAIFQLFITHGLLQAVPAYPKYFEGKHFHGTYGFEHFCVEDFTDYNTTV